ncbi:hypothetical protein G8A07_00675 [Roseateles sp. DAIF2]|uniref:DNA-binding protein n=1 Tax=Roseateles sp. DAIF2 TaxID=2714952 RepID=UPI0018A32FE0|nr:DNA-binding protein [Roseateles sp. DAIF2]QPF71580.1 hypothetical protein G8A07_00675 [Roseateles sp. DAIF2]
MADAEENNKTTSNRDIGFEQVAAAAQRLADGGRPVTLGGLRDTLGAGASAQAIHPHLAAWRAAQAPAAEAPKVELPAPLAAALGDWARQLAEDAAAGLRDKLSHSDGDLASLLQLNEQAETARDALSAQLAALTEERDQALARLAERDASIERLTIELRHARDIASDALVGKAKDQLAIEGKEAQLADLRRQIERHVAASATESDARLAAEMELVGATTARDNFAAEIAELRAQLDALRAGR